MDNEKNSYFSQDVKEIVVKIANQKFNYETIISRR